MPTIGEIQKYFSDRGWKLLSTDCPGSKSVIYAECTKGHLVKTCWNKFQQVRRCKECSGKKKKTIAGLTIEFTERGWELLDTKYKNSRTPLEARCPKGHLTTITWDNLKAGQGCMLCLKPPYEEVRQAFEDRGWQLLSTIYENATKKLDVVCSEGHSLSVTYGDFSRGGGCAECSGKKPKTQEFIDAYFSERGYKVLEKYTACQVPFLVECPEGHQVMMSWNNFSNGSRCMHCSSLGSVSRVSQEWLDALGVDNREVPISCDGKVFRVDGFCPETKTVFEFLGDYWHGNPAKFDQDAIHPATKKTFGQLFDETIERLFLLRQNGFNLNVVWEDAFRKWT